VDLRGLHRPSSPRVRSGIRPAHVVGPRGSRGGDDEDAASRNHRRRGSGVFFLGRIARPSVELMWVRPSRFSVCYGPLGSHLVVLVPSSRAHIIIWWPGRPKVGPLAGPLRSASAHVCNSQSNNAYIFLQSIERRLHLRLSTPRSPPPCS
jgi:hypothetical protein